MATEITQLRNIGISAHIDSGKTTLTERILFYCHKIHRMHEVKGKDGVGATMDSMELERERGITISSAATNVTWGDHTINIIDTPGHVDFTIEVERSLRVLDGAVLVLCSVGGVQSQTITVDRQLRRYKVPCLAFINKLDRTGADPFKVKNQLVEKLGRNAVLMQIPIDLEDRQQGIIDLVTREAVYFDGVQGEAVRREAVPAELNADVEKHRQAMLDAVSMFSDELTEAVLEGRETPELVMEAVRRGTVARELMPILMGSAYKNKGVQLLLDAVVRYLPNPAEVENIAYDLDSQEKSVALSTDPEADVVALAFKLEEGPYGQLTYIRIYQGRIEKGAELQNSRTGKTIRAGRLIRMHADSMEEIEDAAAGDIVALFGVDCHSGDTFVKPGLNLAMSSIYVPEPVISLAVFPADNRSADSISKALKRFTKEDPTFRTHVDPESRETIIQGMGELHLDVYIERMKREYQVAVRTGMPQVAYRESIALRTEFDYTHKKQTGGAGQFGRVIGFIEPHAEKPYEFVNQVKGGRIPREFIPACDKGFQASLKRGRLIGYPITGIKVTLTDGQAHEVDSSDIAFQSAAQGAFRQAYEAAKPYALEPIMRLSVEGPAEFLGNIFAGINQRRGIIVSSVEDGMFARVDAEVPLSEMFGYSTVLRSLTQGKAEFTMEFLKYARVPAQVAEKLIAQYQEKLRKKQEK
ncbi:MAG TPA: elongation factor G [Candidatus Desulfaltia sp.]|nr:elongation factor G [Candidatus Desulfaltia sp.]